MVTKVELLTHELWSVKRDSEGRVGGLEAQLQEARLRLDGYEKIEHELDDIVMQSAQCRSLKPFRLSCRLITMCVCVCMYGRGHAVEHSCDAERILFTYGFGISVPTNSRRRLQQRYDSLFQITSFSSSSIFISLSPFPSDIIPQCVISLTLDIF